jgi:anti-sigma regulatory factor (Ser/Thr protein kinase)
LWNEPDPGTASTASDAVVGGKLRRRDLAHATAEFTLHAQPTASAEARAAVRGVLTGWGLPEFCDTAMLLCSELVTNAVRHAGTRLRIGVERLPGGGVRISVSDQARSGRPRLAEPSQEAESGRGLWLVDRLANAWGTEAGRRGKTVWFELIARGSVAD